MHVTRKRYRPLDSAEERAVHATQRVELRLLEDEQSYCFSWPEAPMTQWLRESSSYASLHQLIATPGWSGTGGGPSEGVNTGGFLEHAANTGGGVAGGQRETLSTSTVLPSSPAPFSFPVAASGVTVAGTLSSSSRRQVDLSPVFSLGDISDGSSGSLRSDGVCGRDEVQGLLRRLGDEIAAVHTDRPSDSSGHCGSAWSASSPFSHRRPRNVRDNSAKVQGVRAAPRASIVIAADAMRAVPHPLAPPRPHSVTEDSIFTLSETQLMDLEAAGVRALCAAEEAEEEDQRQQHEDSAPHAKVSHNTDEQRHSQRKKEEEEQQRASPSPTMVVVVEEVPVSGSGSCSRSAEQRRRSPQHQRHQHHHHRLPEAHRRIIEHEIAGLEWRTWTQSQRTASALQRLLSLEAAVPFQPVGTPHRDAWRAAVYQLWLKWRQQIPHNSTVKAVSTSPACPTHYSTTRCLSLCVTPASSLEPAHASSAVFGVPLHRLPWGAPLLAGAYLHGTSDDYFICLPPTAAPPGTTTTTTSSSLAAAATGSGSCGGGASVWPAMSRRRGAYSFLRWKVELYQAQLSYGVDGASGEETRHQQQHQHQEQITNINEDRDEGEAGEATGRQAVRPSRYAKGPLGLTDTFTSGRPKRHSTAAASLLPAPLHPLTPVASRKAALPPPPQLTPSHASHAVMGETQIKELVHTTVLTQPPTELAMDDEPSAVRERLACPDLRSETDAWRVWLSKV